MLSEDVSARNDLGKTHLHLFTKLLPGLEWATLLLGIFLFTITETYNNYVTVGMCLLVMSSIARVLRTQRWFPRTNMEVPAAIFVGSAALAAFIAYDRYTAFLQFVRILALFALFYMIVEAHENWLRWLAAGFLLAAAFLAIYWPLQNDFLAFPGKLVLITQIGLAINKLTSFIPISPGLSIHSNVAGGTLALALPFGAVLTWDLWKHSWRIRSRLAACLTLIVLFGLFLTSSRGGWLAIIVTVSLSVMVILQRRFFHTSRQKLIFWTVLIVLGVLGVAVVWFTRTFDKITGVVPDANGLMFTRLQLWQQGFDLVKDYPFTGIGLTTYWMTHATYRLLIHTPIIAHSHNSFLQVWIEQGLSGIIALVSVLIITLIWIFRALDKPSVPTMGWAGLAALSIVSIHGIVDVVFYVERTLPLIGLALGYTWFAANSAPRRRFRIFSLWWVVLGVIITVGAVSIMTIPTVKAAWYVNLGVLQQSRSELGAFDPVHFDNPTMDQVRRQLDLRPAVDAFNEALAIDLTNRTALQRLAQISLSRGEYSAALEYVHRLWRAGWRDEVTRMLYGDALVANQNPIQAADILRGLPYGKMRLRGQAWYRYWLNQDYQRAAAAWNTVLLLDPQETEIKYWLALALDKIN